MKKYLSLCICLLFICMNTKNAYAITYNSSLFPVGYQGSDREKVVFYSRTLKYEDNYYLEGATLEVTDDSHPEYVIVTFRHYVGHSGDNVHSNYMVVPCAFYVNDQKVAQWFISGYDNKEGSQYKKGYRFRNTYRLVYTKEGIKIPRGETIRLSAYDVGTSDETVSPLIWSKDYYYDLPLYHLTISSSLDEKQTKEKLCTFDVFIDNEKMADDVSSYDSYVYHNQTYEIKDLKEEKGISFDKVIKGSLKEKMKEDKDVELGFKKDVYSFRVVFDQNQYGTSYDKGARVKSFDVYKNGQLAVKNASEYEGHSYYNDTYSIKNIIYKERAGYKDYTCDTKSVTYFNGDLNILHDIESDCTLSINTLLFDVPDKVAYIRFIDKETLSTLYEKSIWNKDSNYRTLLNNSLHSTNAKYTYKLDKQTIKTIKQNQFKPSTKSNKDLLDYLKR